MSTPAIQGSTKRYPIMPSLCFSDRRLLAGAFGYRNEIIDYYSQLKALSDETAGAVIADREKTADNVAVVP